MTTMQLPRLVGQDKLTNSRRNCFKTCNRKHYFAYELGIRPDTDATALRIGSVVHKALEVFWSRGGLGPTTDVVFANYEQVPDWCKTDADLLEWQYEFGTVLELMNGYVRQWSDSTPKAVAVELEYDVPIRNPETGAKSRTFSMAGKIDAIAHIPAFDDELAIVEHKTTGDDISPESDYWRRLRIDPQITGYYHAARELGHKVTRILYDVIRKPSIRPERVALTDDAGCKIVLDSNGQRVFNKNGKPRESASKEDGWVLQTRPQTPDEWRAKLSADITSRPDYYFQRREIPRLDSDLRDFLDELWQDAELIREAKNKQRYPRNTGACIGFGRCAYLDVCHLGMDVEMLPVGMRHVDNVNPELTGEAE